MEGEGYVKTQQSLYPIYYADDDMFRLLCAMLREKFWMRSECPKVTLILIISLNYNFFILGFYIL